MTKSRAIKLNCLDCSGGSPKEVTLCHIFNCPLWQFRFGYLMKNKMYKERMLKAKENFKDDLEVLKKEFDIDFTGFLIAPKD